jgi:hypothetical protein
MSNRAERARELGGRQDHTSAPTSKLKPRRVIALYAPFPWSISSSHELQPIFMRLRLSTFSDNHP